MALPLTTGLRGERQRGGEAVDRLGFHRRQHAGRIHRRDADVLLDIEAAAADDQPLPGMHDAADALDGDGLAFEHLGALGERCFLGDAGGIGHVLAQHQFDQRTVDQVGNGEHPLPGRGRPQEHRPGADGEVGAAGDHRVGRAHADQRPGRDLEALLLIESGVLGDERRAEGERRGRQRQENVDFLRMSGGGNQPNNHCEGRRPMSVFEHPILPYNRSRYSSVTGRKPQETRR